MTWYYNVKVVDFSPRIPMKLAIALLAFASITSCSPKPDLPMDQATVVARNASLRLKNSSTSRTLQVLDTGDKVEVLEHQDNWYRVRYGPDVQGWMEESTVLTNETKNKIQKLVAASQNLASQNTAVLKQDANMRLEPGRSTAVIRKLESKTPVEVLDRVTKPRPGSDSHDMWLRVRPTPTEVGWVLSTAVDFDIPTEIAPYSEEYVYAAVKSINQVQDPLAGTIKWYVVGERKPSADPNIDFQGIRVFTWNMKKHRYETAFRIKGMRGVYPLEVGMDGVNPSFRVYELDEDGTTKSPKDFVMYGVIVRQKRES
jgi:SH3-like domain-containing protein